MYVLFVLTSWFSLRSQESYPRSYPVGYDVDVIECRRTIVAAMRRVERGLIENSFATAG